MVVVAAAAAAAAAAAVAAAAAAAVVVVVTESARARLSVALVPSGLWGREFVFGIHTSSWSEAHER